MQIFFPKEESHEIRATILPEVAKKFIDLGIQVSVESGLGDKVFVSDHNKTTNIHTYSNNSAAALSTDNLNSLSIKLYKTI